MAIQRLFDGSFHLLVQLYQITAIYIMPSGLQRSLEGDGAGGSDSALCSRGDEINASASSDAAASIVDTSVMNITDVLDQIGVEVYKYLHPKDLLSFSLASHHVHEEVSKGIIQACLRQMPPNFGSYGVHAYASEAERIDHIILFGVDHVVQFKERHSFPTQDNLLDHLLQKVRTAELKLVGCEEETMDESLAKARGLLRTKKGTKFFSFNHNLPIHLRKEYTSAGSHYEKDDKKLAANRAEYILSRMKKEGAMHQHIPIIRVWINYILAQPHVVAGTWFWSCRHRNLDFQGVEGKGVTISSPYAEGEEMEICWTRMTASRV